MALVDTTTGEVVSMLDEQGARDLTDRIKVHAETLWALLLEAHDRQAWRALGYSSWREYGMAEFGMSQSRAYQILDQGRVIREIEAATGLSTKVEIEERAAREIKPRLEVVKEKIRERITCDTPGGKPDPDRARDIVAEVVAEERAALQKKREDREAIRSFEAEHTPPGWDAAEDQARILARTAVQRAITELADADDVERMAAEWPDYARHHLDLIPAALHHLSTLARLMEVRSEAV